LITFNSVWGEIPGSFVSLSLLGDPDSDSFMFMMQYDYSGQNTNINFYVIQFVVAQKFSPDFTFQTSFDYSIKPMGGQWGFGSVPDSIISNDGYTSTNGYNSYVAQNLSVDYVRTWDVMVPIISANDEFAIFNASHQSKSIYDINRDGLYLPSNTAADDTITPNLNFQLFVPDDDTNNDIDADTLAKLANSAIEYNQLVTITESTTNFQTLNPGSNLFNFAVNSTSGYNIVEASEISCILKGSYVLTNYGYTLIEKLKIGDVLITHDERETKIKKIDVVATNTIKNPPYVVQKGQYNAFEDLYLSFGHSLLINNIFMPAYAVDGLIKKVSNKRIGYYYSLMTDDFKKDVIIVNGVMVETWGGGYPPDFQVEGLTYETEKETGHSCRILQK
jgi:hypothetical protein